MSVVLEHSRLKSAVEDEVLGPSKQRVFRVLRGRLVSTTAPAATLSRKRKGQRLAPLKRRTGVLRGVTDFQCGLVRKAHRGTKLSRLYASSSVQLSSSGSVLWHNSYS